MNNYKNLENNNNYKDKRYNNYDNREYNNNEPKPHFFNTSNKKINNDIRINPNEEDSKYNYNRNNNYSKRGKNEEFGPKKFYGKIRTDRGNKPKKNYDDIENKTPKEEGEENFEKPKFVNSQLDNTEGNENIKELETKGDLFLEKFKKLEDSSKVIEKVEIRDDKQEDIKEGEEEYKYHKRESNKRKYHKNYKYNYYNKYGGDEYSDENYFNEAFGQKDEKEKNEEYEENEEKEEKVEKKEKKEIKDRRERKDIKERKDKKDKKGESKLSKKDKKRKEKEKEDDEKIEGVIKEGNKTIVKSSGAKNLKDLFK